MAQEFPWSEDEHIQWKLGDQIGEGAYSKVYEWINTKSGVLLAAKQFKLTRNLDRLEYDFVLMKREINVLRRLDHPNVVRYYQTDLDEKTGQISLILQYVQGGSLKSLLRKYQKLEEPIIKSYTEQLLSGLEYLHSNSIIHRDLKSANVLIGREGNIKITDFGSCKKFASQEQNYTKSMKGSPYWMAPEVAAQKGHSYPADIWSLGCLIIEMVTGHPPWSDFSNRSDEVIKLITTDKRVPKIPNCSAHLQALISSCLKRNPNDRPTAGDLLEFPFIAGYERTRPRFSSSVQRSTSAVVSTGIRTRRFTDTSVQLRANSWNELPQLQINRKISNLML